MSLARKRVLVTSGPTRGYIDAVRYVTNQSTGALGSLIAVEVLRRGADVTFVYGKGSLTPECHGLSDPELTRLREIEIDTVEDLVTTLRSELSDRPYDVVVHSMAVLDYVPESALREKVVSGRDEWVVKLIPTPKVIALIKTIDPEIFLVGFKLEVNKGRDDLAAAGYQALKRYGADLFIANDLSQIKRGEHMGYIVNPEGEVVGEGKGKEEIAQRLLEIVEKQMEKRRTR